MRNTGSKFNLMSSTVGAEGLKGSFDLTGGAGYFKQDVQAFIDNAKYGRDKQEALGHTKGGHRKFATIPDAIALKILEVHGLDLHDPAFMSDKQNMTKFKAVIMREYPELVENT